MIYLKIQNKVYNNLNLDKFIKDYPISAGRYLALHRIIFNTLRNQLKNYPDIDVVLTDKRQKYTLGRFIINKNKEHKEYKFIEQKTGIPYIVIYAEHCLEYFYLHKVKGFKENFLHEFYHYKQWLLNEPLKHSRDLRAIDNPLEVDKNLKVIGEALNRAGQTGRA